MDIGKLHAAAKDLASNNTIQGSKRASPLLPDGLVQGPPTREQVLEALEHLERHQRSTPNLQVRVVQIVPISRFPD